MQQRNRIIRRRDFMDSTTTDEELDRMLEDLNATIHGAATKELELVALERENSGSLTMNDKQEDVLLLPRALPSTSRHPWQGRKLTPFNFSALACYWYGWSFVWMSLVAVIIPAQIEYIVGPDLKDEKFGIVMWMGAIGSIILSPLFGALSDRSTSIYGRRRPFILAGTVMGMSGLSLMAVSPPFVYYCIAYGCFVLETL
eukprot:UN24876